ncbi:hypothetical protein CDIK_1071 [Cucumispora dikerogammari]|nr:hypothetical protein CDIK_1071 [Cucumispora dikerogammari]
MLIFNIAKIISQLPLNNVYKLAKTLRNKHKIYVFLLTNTLIVLLLINSTNQKNTIFTKQFLYGDLDTKTIFQTKKKFLFNFEIKNTHLEFFLEQRPDFQTIFILGNINQLSHFINLMLKLSTLKLLSKNIKVILCSDPSSFKTRSFLTINLDFNSNKNKIRYNFLERFTPNSDVFFFFQNFYEIESMFQANMLDQKFNDVFQNKIFLSIKNDKKSLTDFCVLIRHLMNLESHSLGFYYYLPSNSGYFSAFVILRIIFFILFNEFDFEISSFNLEISDLMIICTSYFRPLFIFLLLKNKKNNLIFSSIYVLFLSFNWGMLFVFFVWVKQIFTIILCESLAVYKLKFLT